MTRKQLIDNIRGLDKWTDRYARFELTQEQAEQLIQSYCDQEIKKLKALSKKVTSIWFDKNFMLNSPLEFNQLMNELKELSTPKQQKP